MVLDAHGQAPRAGLRSYLKNAKLGGMQKPKFRSGVFLARENPGNLRREDAVEEPIPFPTWGDRVELNEKQSWVFWVGSPQSRAGNHSAVGATRLPGVPPIQLQSTIAHSLYEGAVVDDRGFVAGFEIELAQT